MLIEDDRRHSVDAAALPERFERADFIGEFAAGEDFAGAIWIEASFAHGVDQHGGIAGRVLIGEIGFEQRFLEWKRAAFEFGPMQQTMRVERIPDAAVGAVVEGESEIFAGLLDGLTRGDSREGCVRTRWERPRAATGSTVTNLDSTQRTGMAKDLSAASGFHSIHKFLSSSLVPICGCS